MKTATKKSKVTRSVRKTRTAGKNPKLKIGNDFVNTVNTAMRKAVLKKAPTTTGTVKNPLLKALVVKDNVTLTDNGAKTYKSTLNSVLDFFAMAGAVRSRGDAEVIQLFSKALAEDKLLAAKALFNVRNVRGGAGERKAFRTILRWLGDNYAPLVKKNLDNIAFFGRIDDIYSLFGTKSEGAALEWIKDQINKDVGNYNNDKSISLAAKWLPSENASSDKTRRLGNKVRSYLQWTPKQYRKTLAALRAYSNVVEVKMSANQWGEIDYSSVPSKANLNYKKAFSKHDAERYTQFIADVKSGKKKINASALFPYEVVRQAFAGGDSQTLDVLWDALPNYMEDNERNILCVCDVSASMICMNSLPLFTSISLGIYTAERNTGPFKDYFITFSTNPSLQRVVGGNIREKVNNLAKADWQMSTDLQAVFSLVLDTAVKGRLKQKDLPAQILIISDMEFNRACGGGTNLDAIRRKYAAAGYDTPQLVFWNVNSMKNNVPATADENGVVLVSGADPSVFKTLLTGKQYTPIDQMLATLNAPQYDRVIV